jgi:hypothetical protein
MSYSVNQFGIIFIPELDKKNGYKTIAYDVEKDELIKINMIGYFILKTIDKNPRISFEDLIDRLRELEETKNLNFLKVLSFLKKMVRQNIVVENEKN